MYTEKMPPDERAAHDAILKWCREPRASAGRAMRNGNNGECFVVDCTRTEALPGENPRDPYARSRTYRFAEGKTWIEALANLRERGHLK